MSAPAASARGTPAPLGELHVNPFLDGLQPRRRKGEGAKSSGEGTAGEGGSGGGGGSGSGSEEADELAKKRASGALLFLPLLAPPGLQFHLRADFVDDLTLRTALAVLLFQSFTDEVYSYTVIILLKISLRALMSDLLSFNVNFLLPAPGELGRRY